MKSPVAMVLTALLLAGCSGPDRDTPPPTEATPGSPLPARHPHARALLNSTLSYLDPAHGLTDPASGYFVEGWNQDPEQGLFLRSFTQLTAIGTWTEILAHIATGQLDVPTLTADEARQQLRQVIDSLRHDQQDPGVSCGGLLGNFIGFSPDRRLGPLTEDVDQKDLLEAIGPDRGMVLWQALQDKEWIKPQNLGDEAKVLRGEGYGSEHFDGPLEAFAGDADVHKIMEVLDRRVPLVMFGDNANLSASVARAVGAFLREDGPDDPEQAALCADMEAFLDAQAEGYRLLFDEEAGLFHFGWDATRERYIGWMNDKGEWQTGYSDYLVNEFRGPTLFILLRHGFPESAYGLLGCSIKPHTMQDGSERYVPAPWEGSAFQALGLSLCMYELADPAWGKILRDTVDVELDYAGQHGHPGLLSESYSGNGIEYTGDIGLPAITVSPNPRITDAPSLYMLGPAYQIAPDAVEAFLAEHDPVIRQLFTDHGPWEGWQATEQQPIPFQTTAHTFSLLLGLLGTGQAHMSAYLAAHDLFTEAIYHYGPGADFLDPAMNVFSWCDGGAELKTTRDDQGFRVAGPTARGVHLAFVENDTQGVDLSGCLLTISYQSHRDLGTAWLNVNPVTARPDAALPNRVLLRLLPTSNQTRTLSIQLPPTLGLTDVKELVLSLDPEEESGGVALAITELRAQPAAPAP